MRICLQVARKHQFSERFPLFRALSLFHSVHVETLWHKEPCMKLPQMGGRCGGTPDLLPERSEFQDSTIFSPEPSFRPGQSQISAVHMRRINPPRFSNWLPGYCKFMEYIYRCTHLKQFFQITQKRTESKLCPSCVGITYFPGPSPDKYLRQKRA